MSKHTLGLLYLRTLELEPVLTFCWANGEDGEPTLVNSGLPCLTSRAGDLGQSTICACLGIDLICINSTARQQTSV